MDINFNKINKIQKYQDHHLKGCLSLFNTNTPIYFAKGEKLLFKNYLQTNHIHYYVLFKKNIIVASGGYGFNKKEKTIDLTWGMVDLNLHKKGYGKTLLNYRMKKISADFPNKNITLGSCYTEYELREKADIHRARLSKFGKSKINGEMLFVGPKGGIYKISEDGKKKYV